MSGQYVDTNCKAFQASAALGQWRRVKLDANMKLEYAGASDTDWIGVTTREVLAADDWVDVMMRTKNGTMPAVISEAFSTAGTAGYAAASGKVATSGSVLVGECLETGSGDGSVCEFLLSTTAVLGTIARSALSQDDAAVYNIPLTQLKTWDALATNLPATAGNDDLGLITGTFGTDAPTVQAGDFGGASITRYARFQFALPPEYVDGETVTLRAHAGMLTTVADTSCTLDASAYETTDAGAVGSDLVSTSAININSLTLADRDFTITPTGLAAGDLLDIRLAVAGVDSGDAGVMIPEITKVQLLLDVKG